MLVAYSTLYSGTAPCHSSPGIPLCSWPTVPSTQVLPQGAPAVYHTSTCTSACPHLCLHQHALVAYSTPLLRYCPRHDRGIPLIHIFTCISAYPHLCLHRHARRLQYPVLEVLTHPLLHGPWSTSPSHKAMPRRLGYSLRCVWCAIPPPPLPYTRDIPRYIPGIPSVCTCP